MKRNNVISVFAAFLCAAASICGCISQDSSRTGKGTEIRLFLAEEDGCRSSLHASEMEFPDNVILLIYDAEGILVKSISPDRRLSTTDNRLYIDDIPVGREYYIYALAGANLKRSDYGLLETIDGAESICIGFSDFMNGGEMVYSHVPQGPVLMEDGHNYEIGLKRIAAKYHFIIDQSNMDGRFTVRSLAVRQSPAKTYPFAGECRLTAAGDAADGDSAGAADIAALNGGAAAHFYLFENLQGNVLPGNEDPWEKVPANLSGTKGGLVSYIEITGSYQGAGITVDPLVYRFILGEDNLSNCDVRRNTVQTVTLVLSDENAVLKESWKVTRGAVDDRRRACFSTDTLYVYPYPGRTDTIGLNIEPAGVRCTVSIDTGRMADYPFEIGYDTAGNVVVRSLKFIPQSNTTAYFPVYVGTADGLVGDTLTVAYRSLDRINVILPSELYSNFEGWMDNGEGDRAPIRRSTARDRSDESGLLIINLNYNGVRKNTSDTVFERGLVISSSRSSVISSSLSETNPTLWYLSAHTSGSARITASYTMDGVTKSGSTTISPLQLYMDYSATSPIHVGESCRPDITLHNNDGDVFPWGDCVVFTSLDGGVLANNGRGISAGTATLEARYVGLTDESVLFDSKRITVLPIDEPEGISQIRLAINSVTIQESHSSPVTYSPYIPGSVLTVNNTVFTDGCDLLWCTFHQGGTVAEKRATIVVALYATDAQSGEESLLTEKSFSFSIMRDDEIIFDASDFAGFLDGNTFGYRARIIVE